MYIITQAKKGRQLALIAVYEHGIHVPSPIRGTSTGTGGGGDNHKRGEITGFSAASRRRMRQAMLTKYIPGADLVGITCTVPWQGTDFEPLMDEFRECVHRFRTAFVRRFPKSAAIYRVELQERGAPHLHALVWMAAEDLAALLPCACRGAAEAAGALAADKLSELWRRAVVDLHHGSLRAFEEHGTKVESIKSAGAMFRYLADHASKHKQAQLGYKGKQWGIIGRGNLEDRKGLELPPFDSNRHWFIFNRLLRKVMRYRLQASRHHWKRLPPFGSVLKGSRRTVGDFYLLRNTALRMYEHARMLARGGAL